MAYITNIEARVAGIFVDTGGSAPGRWSCIMDDGSRIYAVVVSSADAVRVGGGSALTIPSGFTGVVLVKVDVTGAGVWASATTTSTSNVGGFASDGTHVYAAIGFPSTTVNLFDSDGVSRLTAARGDVVKMDTDGFWVLKSTVAFKDTVNFPVNSIDVGGGRVVVGTQTGGITSYATSTLAQEWLVTAPGRPGGMIVAVSDTGNVANINRGTTAGASRVRFDIRDGATGTVSFTNALTTSSRPNLIAGRSTLAFNGNTVALVAGIRASSFSATITFDTGYTYSPPVSEFGLVIAVFDTGTSSWVWSSELAIGNAAAADGVGGAVGSVVDGKVRAMWQKQTATDIFFQQFDAVTGSIEWTASASTLERLAASATDYFSHSFNVDDTGSGWFALPAITTYTSSDASTDSGLSSVNLGNINKDGLFGVTSIEGSEVVTDAPSNITTNTADLNGTLVSDGGNPPVTGGFEIATSPDPDDIEQTIDAGTIVVGSFTETATGLTPGEIYYVRAFATTDIGTNTGDWVEFEMLSFPPVVTTRNSTELTFFTANLSGSLISAGESQSGAEDGIIDIVGFVLSLDDEPELGDVGIINLVAVLEQEDGSFSAQATGLTPGTEYYWRAYGINTFEDIGYGNTKTFNTRATQGPSFVRITMPNANENNTSVGIADFETDPMETGTYVWEVSGQTEEPYTGGTSAVLIDGNSITAGTVAITGQDNGAQTAEVTFTPEPNWFGTVQFSIRVSNTFEFSNRRTANVTIVFIPDPPSAPSGTLPTLDEDTTATFDMTWTDPDDIPPGSLAATDGYALEVRSGPGLQFRTLTSQVPAVNLTNFTIRLLEYSDSSLKATLRVEPVANYNGPYGMQVRVRDEVDDVRLFGPTETFEGFVTSVPDVPTRPQPARMTTARKGQVVVTRFTTFDPDLEDTSWVFEVSERGADDWYSEIVIADVGTITVIDDDVSDRQANVRLVQIDGGATDLRYSFDLRVTDSSGLISPVQTVNGFITLPGATVFLQKVSRPSGAVIETLTPLREVLDLVVIDSIDGVGGATATVSTEELRRRASQLNVDIRELLDPGTVEIVVAIGTEVVFTGPIGDVEWSATGQTVEIGAQGLLSYFEDRRIGTGTKNFVNEDIATIIATLVADTQAKSSGDLAIVDDTIPAASNLTVDFASTDRVLSAIRELSQADGGPEVWISPDRELQNAALRGSDKRATVRITAGMMEAATWKTRDEMIATVVTVIGGEDGLGGFFEGTAITSDTDALSRYGRKERVINRRSLTSNEECEDYASRQVNQQSRRIEDVRLRTVVTPDRPFSIRDVEIGDIITVDLRAPDIGQIIGAYRINNRELRLVSETADSYQLSLDLVNAPIEQDEVVKIRARQNPSIFERLAQQE